VASIALIAYSIMLLGIFKMIPVTLTLSGAAAVILSLGFAVDANVLIAERTKEELRSGRSLLAAITAGFDRAWPSIRDGNVSTIIVAIVLFWFGDRFSTSVMQGFALTLAIGVLLSMFTAFFASRLLLRLIAISRIGNNTNLFVPVRDQKEQSESASGGNS
jgi:preprotein translocase subunit SecD